MLEDLPCTGCGYNLKGLTVTGVCPECGREVMDSTGDADRPKAGIEVLRSATQTYGSAHRNTMVFALACVFSSTPCLLTVVSVVVFLGVVQRAIGLFQMRRAVQLTSDRVASAHRLACVATGCEALAGALLLATALFNLSMLPSVAAGGLDTFTLLVLVWSGPLGFGLLASAALSDALATHYVLHLERSRAAVAVAFAAPSAGAAAMGLWVLADLVGSRVLTAFGFLATLGAAALWVFAGWAAYCYATGTADRMHSPSDTAPVRRDDLAAVPQPAAYTSPEEQAAAQRLREDDSPIPMD